LRATRVLSVYGTLGVSEAGKVSILRALAVARTDDEVRGCWKDYRSHTHKNYAWISPQLFASGARQLDHFRPMFGEGSDHPALLDNLKKLGFYTDCLGKRTLGATGRRHRGGSGQKYCFCCKDAISFIQALNTGSGSVGGAHRPCLEARYDSDEASTTQLARSHASRRPLQNIR
ncbi:hypothetical protein xavtCFBP7764_12370, partial [Xanthomonas citri]